MQVHKPASADNNRADIIFLREYNYGVMSTETVLRMADKDAHRKAIKKHKSEDFPSFLTLCILQFLGVAPEKSDVAAAIYSYVLPNAVYSDCWRTLWHTYCLLASH